MYKHSSARCHFCTILLDGKATPTSLRHPQPPEFDRCSYMRDEEIASAATHHRYNFASCKAYEANIRECVGNPLFPTPYGKLPLTVLTPLHCIQLLKPPTCVCLRVSIVNRSNV